MNYYDIRREIKDLVRQKGGFCNAHSHLDKSYTLTKDNKDICNKHLKNKWNLIDSIKRNSTIYDIKDRIEYSLIKQTLYNTHNILTFIDVDSVAKSTGLEALELAKENYLATQIYSANQTIKGILNKKEYEWFLKGAEQCDFIGSLPKVDDNIELHLDILFDTAKNFNKHIQIHCDQFSLIEEKETELILKYIDKYNWQGKVSLIHCLSLASQEKSYRYKIYEKLEETRTNIIIAPLIWIDTPRNEELQPRHNCLTPVDEMLEFNINIAMGTDNISDLNGMLSNGDMMEELIFLIRACRLYNKIEECINIATINGNKIINNRLNNNII